MIRKANLLIASVAVFFCCTATFAALNLGPAINISNSNMPTEYDAPAQIALNDYNKAITVWTEINGSVDNIYTRMFDGTNWSTPATNLNNNILLQANAYGPQIALNNDGFAIAVWPEDTGSAYNNIYARTFDGSSWSTPATDLNYSSTRNTSNPQIALNDSNKAIAVWAEDNGLVRNIYERTFDGSSWSTPATDLNYSSTRNAFDPQIALNDSNKAIAVWSEDDGLVNNIYARTFDGTSWSTTATDLNYSSTRNTSNPQIALNDSNKAIAVWAEDNGSVYNIYARTFNGTNWSAATDLNNTSTQNAEAPQIAINNAGNAIVVWKELNGPVSNIYARTFNGTNWSATTTNLNYDSNNDTNVPQIALNNAGNAFAVWEEYINSIRNIYARTFDGTSWQDAKNINNNSVMTSEVPITTLNNLGTSFTTWQEGTDGDNGRVFVRQTALPYTYTQWLSPVTGSKQYISSSRVDDLGQCHFDIYEYTPSTGVIEFKTSTLLDYEPQTFAVYNKSDTDMQIAAILPTGSVNPPYQQLQTFKFNGTSLNLTADLSASVTGHCADAQWWVTSATQSYLAVISDAKLTILDLVNLSNSASLDASGDRLLWTLASGYNGVVVLGDTQATPYKVDLSTSPVTIEAGTPLTTPTGLHFTAISTCGDYIAVGLSSTSTISYGYAQVHLLTLNISDTSVTTLSFSGTSTILAGQDVIPSLARCCCCATSRPLIVGSYDLNRNYNVQVLAPDLSQVYASTLLGNNVTSVAWDCQGENVHLAATANEDLNAFTYSTSYNFAPISGTLSYPAVLYH